MYKNPVHEVVISGVAGLFPESDDVDELWDRLMSKEDMVTIDNRRWIPGEFDVPPGTGKIRSPEKFDMTFFGIHRKLCEKMDPYTRLLCEQAYRSICDAGVNPRYLDGKNTAVVMGSFSSEPEHDMGASLINQGTYNVLAFSRTMHANRLSYFLNLKGPSFQIDCAGVGGVQALQYACDLIASGMCTTAIVGSCSLLNKPDISVHYQGMGRISEDSITRSFSSDASGYARSEGCVTLFLQRREHAKRIYGIVRAAEVDGHGSKPNSFPDFPMNFNERFLTDTYRKAKINPKDVSYVEAYGSASKKLDAMELNALGKVFTKGRKDPLLVGSIKSNVGHTEGCTAMVSLTKALLVLDRGIIPPNINYSEPNPDVPHLLSGKMKVVVEPTPLEGKYVGVSDISITGLSSHVILERHSKVKPVTNDDESKVPLPYLVMMSGRSEEVLESNMKKLENLKIDEEITLLLNGLYKDGIKPHVYRGYTVIGDSPNTYHTIEPAPSGEKRPIWFMYSGMGSQWATMAKSLMCLPIFANAINKCHEALLPKGLNLLEIVTKDDPSIFDVILNAFVGIAAVQIGLTDILKAVGVEPDGYVGHSVGEMGCAYADGCLTAEQMILAAHARGRASIETELIKGMMAAVGVGYNSIKNQLPDSIEVACHNSKESCTLSGPAEVMAEYIAQLKAKGMFAKLVNVANIAYHSRYIKPAAPALLKYLKEIITAPLKRSSKWVCSSIPESKWGSELAQTCSAEYLTNNLLSSVYFEEACSHVPSNAILIEVAPHGLLQAIVKRAFPQAANIPLTSRFDPDNLKYLLAAIGRIHLSGIPVDLAALYPSVKFPVSRGTMSISPLIDWLRDENFTIIRRINDYEHDSRMCKHISVIPQSREFEKSSICKVNQRTIVSLEFLLKNMVSLFLSVGSNETMPIAVDDLKVLSYAEVPINSSVEVRFKLQAGTGTIVANDCSDDSFLAQVKINSTDVGSLKDLAIPLKDEKQCANVTCVSGEVMSSFMGAMGLERSSPAVADIFVCDTFVTATVDWNGKVAEFLMAILSVVEFYETSKHNVLKLVTKVGQMLVDLPLLFKTTSHKYKVEYDVVNNVILSEVVKISLIECGNPGLSLQTNQEYFFSFEFPSFIPYENHQFNSFDQHFMVCIQTILENISRNDDPVVEIIEVGQRNDIHHSLQAITQSMKYSGNTHLTSFLKEEQFSKRSSSFLLQKNVLLVLNQPPTKGMVQALAVANHAFICAPKHVVLEDTMNVILESVVAKDPYVLSSVAAKNYKRQYEVVNYTENFSTHLENRLIEVSKQKIESDHPVRTVILWGEIDSLTTVGDILKATKNLPNNEYLQYWLFRGEPPKFDVNDKKFNNQIHRNVKVNLFVDGSWGSLRLLPANVNDTTTDLIRPTKFYYPLSAVLESHNLTALGLNLPDTPTQDANNESCLYDYVDSTRMGVGIYDPHTKKFNPDAILSWPQPGNWVAEDAATVPLLYSLASYIIHHTDNAEYTNDKTILVNRALLPLSQAIIALALFENMTVYTSVYGDEEKAMLMGLFPKLHPENIYDCSTSAFFVNILRKTKGVYKVINNFEGGNMIEPCMRLVKLLGVLVYADGALVNANVTMGMQKFNEEAVAKGATYDILMQTKTSTKSAIKQNIQQALHGGAVRPIRAVSILKSSTLNTDAVKFLQLSTNKFIVSSKDTMFGVDSSSNKLYLKDDNKTCIIVEGKIQSNSSLNLLEWLLKRGSRKVILFSRQGHVASVALRLKSLRDNYTGADIDVRNFNSLSSKANVDKLVDDCPTGPGMVFFFGPGLKEKIEMFDDILTSKAPSCSVICMGKGGENICERRKKNALPTLNLRCSSNTLESVDLMYYMDNLIKDLKKNPTVFISKCSVYNRLQHNTLSDHMHIPSTLGELGELLNQSVPTAKFVEIPSAGPIRKFNRDVYPLYLIPGLIPKRMHKLASQLFSPAMEARLPVNVTDLDILANQLTQQLLSTGQNLFTIVGDDWGGILALLVGCKLEAASKTVFVILLDAKPASIKKWAEGLLKTEVTLMEKYLTVPSEIRTCSTSSWEEKLQKVLKLSSLKEEDECMVKNGLDLLRKRLQSIVKSKPPQTRIKHKCFVVELSSQVSSDPGLKEYVRGDPVIYRKDSKNVEEMIDTAVADDLNSLLLYEYKDTANPPIEDFLGVNVIKKPHWQQSTLFRVRQ